MKRLISIILIITTFCTILSGCSQLIAQDDFQDMVTVVKVMPQNRVIVNYNGHEFTINDVHSYNIVKL